MKAKVWLLNEFNQPPQLTHLDLPEPADDQVIIQVEAAPINPSDHLFLMGHYMKCPLPVPAGFEGVGKVVKAGKFAMNVFQKRVCFMGQGSWASHIKVQVFNVIPIDDQVPTVSAACGQVNPLTVLGFLDMCSKGGHKGIVHTVGASALGKQLIRICQTRGIQLISLVRRKEQVEILKELKAEHVICTEQQGWQQQLKDLSSNLKATACFQCVGGDFVGKIFKVLPFGSTLFLYGNLSLSKQIKVSTTEFLQNKRIESFMLPVWLKGLKAPDRKKIYEQHSQLLKNQLGSSVQKQFSLQEWSKAYELYKNSSRTEGKIIIKL